MLICDERHIKRPLKISQQPNYNQTFEEMNCFTQYICDRGNELY